jgi:Family of unknown function (DUF6114)
VTARRVPGLAILLTVAGGFFLFAGGVVMAIFGIAVSLVGLHGEILFTGLLVALLVWVMALLMWLVPTARVAWGAVTVLLAVLSLLFNLVGGLLLGFLLTAAGGLLAVFSRRGGLIYPVPIAPI